MIDTAFFSISAATVEGEPNLLRDFAVITACGGAAMLLLRPLKMPLSLAIWAQVCSSAHPSWGPCRTRRR